MEKPKSTNKEDEIREKRLVHESKLVRTNKSR